MIPLNVEHWEVKIFEVMDLSLDVLEHVMMVNRLIHRPNQILQAVNLLSYLVELMSKVNIFSNREVHLLDCVKALEDFTVLMSSVDLVHRIVQGLQVRQLLFNLKDLNII